MQRIRKIVRAVFQSPGGGHRKNPFLTFLAHFSKFEIFFEKSVFTRFLLIFLPNFMPKIRKVSWSNSEKTLKNLEKPHFWPLLAHFSKNGIFFEKSGFVTFLLIFLPNFMEKIRNIPWPSSCNFGLQTDWRTDRGEIIGPSKGRSKN